MKLKNLSLVVGALVLCLTTPLAVNAQTTTSSPFVIAQKEVGEKGPWKNLGLTDAQKSEIRAIRSNTRTEMDKILDDRQREQLKTAMQNQNGRGNWRRAMSSLNLSDQQKTQIRELMQSQKTKIDAVLTDTQKAQLREYKEQQRARRQQTQQ